MNDLPNGYSTRPATFDDIDTIANLANQYSIGLTGEAMVSPKHLRTLLTTPGLDLASSSRLVFNSESSLAGCAFVMDAQAPHVKNFCSAFVPKEEQGQGIGAALHSWIEPRAREAIAKAPEGARVAVLQSLSDEDKSGKTLLEKLGYKRSRHFWRMSIDLDQALAAPVWPDGIELQHVDLREELERPLRAANEAFRDHYGYVKSDFEQRLERHRHNLENDTTYSPDLSYLAMDGDEIAGVCFCSPESGTDRTVGYVNSLGVLRPWRKRGLGLALLLHAFAVLRDKEKVRVNLHVDADSLTGATRLYEKAGMHVDQLSHEYQLELRPGVDLSTQAAG